MTGSPVSKYREGHLHSRAAPYNGSVASADLRAEPASEPSSKVRARSAPRTPSSLSALLLGTLLKLFWLVLFICVCLSFYTAYLKVLQSRAGYGAVSSRPSRTTPSSVSSGSDAASQVATGPDTGSALATSAVDHEPTDFDVDEFREFQSKAKNMCYDKCLAVHAKSPLRMDSCKRACIDSKKTLWHYAVEMAKPVHQATVKNHTDNWRFLQVGPKGLMEQRNSRLVSFKDMMAIAANYKRLLVEPHDFSLEYDFTKLHELGIFTISPFMFDALTELLTIGDPVKVGFHTCDIAINKFGATYCMTCLPNTEREPVFSFPEWEALAPEVGSALREKDNRLVYFVMYKRCGHRDNEPFGQARSIFLDYKSVWHNSASDFLAENGVLDKPQTFLSDKEANEDISFYPVVATQMRTEKWLQPPLSDECIEPLLTGLLAELDRALLLGIKHFYVASDAIPGGTKISNTYGLDGGNGERRLKYEAFVASLFEAAEAKGMVVVTQPFSRGLTNATEEEYDRASVLDQLICSRAQVFIATCEEKHAGLVGGSKECTLPRKVCGNYGDWIKKYRKDHCGVPIKDRWDGAKDGELSSVHRDKTGTVDSSGIAPYSVIV